LLPCTRPASPLACGACGGRARAGGDAGAECTPAGSIDARSLAAPLTSARCCCSTGVFRRPVGGRPDAGGLGTRSMLAAPFPNAAAAAPPSPLSAT
jgi:hypothetical protein